MKHLILGGVKSGKSRFAEQKAKGLSERVAVVVTAEAFDAEMTERVKQHQLQRPANWRVVEAPLRLSSALNVLNNDDDIDVVIVDCLTLWLTNVLLKEYDALNEQIHSFETAVTSFSKQLLLVSNETNQGLIGPDAITRRFCDESGQLHQRLAALCDQVDLIVAGLPLNLKNAAGFAR